MERIDRIEKAIEELVASQKKTDAQLAKTDAQLAKTDAQLAKTDALFAELAASSKERDIQLAKTDALFAELVASSKERDIQLAKTDALFAELAASSKERDIQLAKTDVKLAELIEQQKLTDAQIKETNRQLGGIGNTNGEFAENFFFSSLSQKMQLGGIKFDYIERNVKRRVRSLTDEFDIVLYNGDSVGLLEIKNNVKASNVTQLLTTKLQNFRTLNPEYADAKIYLGIGGFTFENEGVKASAKAAGIALLEVQGDHFEADIENMKAF